MRHIIFIVLILSFFFTTNLLANDDNIVRVQASATTSMDTLLPGSQAVMSVKLLLIPDNHANSNRPKDPELIPTTFTPEKSDFISWNRVKYPKPTEVIEWYSVEPLSVFGNGAVIQVPFEISEDAPPGEMVLSGKLLVQVCDDEMCYPKKTIKTSVTVVVDSWDD